MAEQLTPIDAAARMSHRHLLAALGLLLLTGLAAMLGGVLWMALPVIITITAGSLYSMSKRIDARSLAAVRNDELRQASLSRAWRNGFFAVLGLQPVLALGLVWSGTTDATAVMAAASVTIGAATVLASLLWYDR
jgi:hypothetical protein